MSSTAVSEKQKVKAKFALDPEEILFKSSTEVFDRIDHSRIIQTFIDLIKLPSPSGAEDAVRDYIISRLQKLGIAYKQDRMGNVIAYKRGMMIEGKTILISAHMDTAYALVDLKPVIGDDLISIEQGQGLGADDKAGLTAILEALEVLCSCNLFKHDHLKIVFTARHEEGLIGSRALSLADIEADMGFVLDAPSDVGNIVHAAPAAFRFKLSLKGISGMLEGAGDAKFNPILEVYQLIAEMQKISFRDQAFIHFGKINSGKATHQVPAELILEGELIGTQDIESYRKQVEMVWAQFSKKTQLDLKYEWEDLFPAYALNPEAVPVEIAARAACALGIPSKLETARYGNDANLFNRLGVPTVSLAVGYENPQSTREQIRISSLVRSTAMLIEVLYQTAGYEMQHA